MTKHLVRTLRPIENARALTPPARVSAHAAPAATRSFQVLQPSRAGTQLPLFAPPGAAARSGR